MHSTASVTSSFPCHLGLSYLYSNSDLRWTEPFGFFMSGLNHWRCASQMLPIKIRQNSKTLQGSWIVFELCGCVCAAPCIHNMSELDGRVVEGKIVSSSLSA